MNKSSLTFILIIALSPFLVQCASQDEMNKIHYQLRMLNKKVNDLESGTIDALMKRQASSSSQFDQLYQEFLQLKSELEETGHLNRRLTEQNKELETAFQNYARAEEEKRNEALKKLQEEIIQKDQNIEQLADQLKLQQENLKAIQQARVEDAKRKAEAAARAAAEARAKAEAANRASSGSPVRLKADKEKKIYSAANPPPSQSQTTETTVQPPTPKKSIEVAAASASGSTSGMELYKQGKYREAYQQFEQLTKERSGSEEAIEARFMMGECLFSLKEYDQAILDYQNIISNSPSSRRAPSAMLRQAMAFQNLNDSDTAKILYQKLLASYKNSPEAAKAKEYLDKL